MLTFTAPSTIEESPPRGYSVHQIDANLSGQRVGYIRISFLNSELCKIYLPTAWHYMTLHRGWCIDINNPASLWKGAHLYAGRGPASRPDLYHYMIRNDDIPDITTIKSDLLALEKPYRREMQEDIRIKGDHPTVEYIKVEEGYRRQGIGMQLYVKMAQYLAEEYGLPLYASGLQSDEAKAVWTAMRKKGLPVKRTTFLGKKKFVLDFRTAH